MTRRNGGRLAALVGSGLLACGLSASASADTVGLHGFEPNHVLISGSDYVPADIQPGVTVLPPGCTSGCALANSDGSYPYVFNNDLVDGSFGVTSPIFINELTPSGQLVHTDQIPTSELVTSFPSKSELALNVSTGGKDVTFMGYAAPLDGLDVSNSNTAGAIDSTNPVPSSYYRGVADLSSKGGLSVTETNAYSGNNGRAAILNSAANLIYTAGNAGNGANPQPQGVVLGAGAQVLSPSSLPEADQTPGTPTPVGSFNITQLNQKADKLGKDDNFRGLTIYNNVVYYTKGSGGNGVDTVYFIDTTGTACPNGTGVPVAGAPLPTSPIPLSSYNSKTGLPSNMCVLQGFPTILAKNNTSFFPFGIWFASPTVLYVADEGSGDNTYDSASGQYTRAATDSSAGLQKWVFDGTTWTLAYTIQAGLNLGTPYTVPGYPTGDNAATGLPWAPATDGLRNISGSVDSHGNATIYAVTSTVSGGGDQGADPNQVVKVTDPLGATSPGDESFETVAAPASGQVLRGVAVVPGGNGH
jgi:hypothetical protein